MAVITQFWFIDVILILSLPIIALYIFYQRQFRYWSKRNVPGTGNPMFILGDLKKSNHSVFIGDELRELYNKYKNERFLGIYLLFRPTMMIHDLELVKSILVRDFSHFHDHGNYVNEEDDPLSGHLFAIGGSKWRNVRAKLTPTFTSGKMKMMFQTLNSCGQELNQYLSELIEKNDVVEIKDILARFSTDIISSCAFGIETNSLRNPNAEFRIMGKKMFEPTISSLFRNFVTTLLPSVAAIFKIHITSKAVSDFFINAVKETVTYREENNVKRNDFMQLLMQLKNVGYIENVDGTKTNDEAFKGGHKFTMGQVAAQAFVFFLAGFETSSTTMHFCLYELSLNPEIQEKTRKNIEEVLAKHEGNLTYEAVHEMDYLDRVVSETLRKYPPVGVLIRECTKDYQIPDTDIMIDKGVLVLIPVIGIQRDPQYFPDPDRFDPDRFLEEEKAKRHHFSYTPFGEGPRVCIGMRFGLMQTKVGLITILSNFNVSPTKETIIPMVLDPKSFVTSPKGGMYLKLSKRDHSSM